MSDAIPLPDRPSLEYYKKLAKDLHKQKPELANRPLADAQSFIARAHGFASWPVFAKHVDALQRASSGTAIFESAVDAIVSGDSDTLARLLREQPGLVHERSTREHHATLLHYVSANGVEDFRQKTPKNIVEIARLLLDAGADVNAGSNSYSANDTVFNLTATSVHPADAGVQTPLLQLLLERGARVDDGDVLASLHNGRGEAAAFCARYATGLNLEAAAGVGRLDRVQHFLRPDGTLTNAATQKQMTDGFAWAAEYGHTGVVEYMLQAGMPLDARLRHDGQTALHWAAWGGHPEMVRLLLERGAPVDIKDRSYDGTPLDWAIYAWGNRSGLRDADAEGYYDVVAQLVRAGGAINSEWFTDDDRERSRARRRMREDPRMAAALQGRA
jgi:ankyrin repeat protein